MPAAASFGKGFKGKGAKATLSPSMAYKQTVKMFEMGFAQLRAKAIQRHIVYEAAQQMLTSVREKVPKSSEYGGYRSALKIVQAGSPSNPVFAVYADAESRSIEGKRDIIFFKPKKRGGRVDPVTQVLIQHQPWTLEALPFTPPKKAAELVVRRVTQDEVDAVAKRCEKSRPDWERQLRELGVRPKPKVAEDKAQTKGIPDLAYTALRLEFGLGRTKAVAHWRPSVRNIKGMVSQMFEKPEVADAMLNWKDGNWRRWVHLNADIVSSSEIEDLVGFQDKVTGNL